MPVKPVLLRDIKKTAAQTHQQQVGSGSYNRFSPLVSRERAFLYGKRPLPVDESTEVARKNPRLDRKIIFDQVRVHEKSIKDLKKMVVDNKANPDLPDGSPDIWKAIGMIVDVQEGLMSAVIDLEAADAAKPCISTAAGIVITGGKGGRAGGPSVNKQPVPEPMDQESAEKKKMRSAIKDAEKKLVIFNLDLGKAPVMNTDTLAKNVALDLGRRVKDGKHDFHIGDAEDVIDDVLSCSRLDFMGTSTRKFFNTKNTADPKNNTFYTMPVKMDFADREIRFQSELSLRKICKVNCSVPYPKTVRTLMDSLIQEGKKMYPDSFIRTKVDADDLFVEAFASVNKKWVNLGLRKEIFPSVTGSGSEELTASDSQSQNVMECVESQTIS